MDSIDYWHGFQDALNLAEYELKTTEGDPLGILHVITKRITQKRTSSIEQELRL
jgi:hypothetical protein